MIRGLDFLGLGSKYWPLQEAIDSFPAGFALGVFAREFGDALPKVRELLKTGKVVALRVQIWFDHDHHIAPMAYLEKELPRWEALHQEFPDIPFYISHSCEYPKAPKKEIEKRVNLVLQLCPSCKVVQTPMKGAYTVPGHIVEKHGDVKAGAGGIVSTDGVEITQIDANAFTEKNQNALICFGWICRFNLTDGKMLKDLKEKGIPLPKPKKRKSYPSQKLCRGVERLLHPGPKWAGTTFPDWVKFKKGTYLWKAFAEDFPNDARAMKPCAMLKTNAGKIEILARNNQVIATFGKYPDTQPHTLERYYSGWKTGPGLFGWEIEAKAIAVANSPYVQLRFKGKLSEPFIPSFRQE